MFDIGWSELFVVVVVALVVVGPKDLPKMMRVAGQWMGRARAMADQFRRSFDEMARQAELDDLRAEVQRLHSEKPLAEIERETDIMLGNIAPDAPPGTKPEDAAAGAEGEASADAEAAPGGQAEPKNESDAPAASPDAAPQAPEGS